MGYSLNVYDSERESEREDQQQRGKNFNWLTH